MSRRRNRRRGKYSERGGSRRTSPSCPSSLRDLAQFLDSRPDLNDVIAICGNLPFEPTERSDQLVRFVGRFGFERIAVNTPMHALAWREYSNLNDGSGTQMRRLFALTHCGVTALWYFYRAKRCNGAMGSSIAGCGCPDCVRPRSDLRRFRFQISGAVSITAPSEVATLR
jgi:hypothetical protein